MMSLIVIPIGVLVAPMKLKVVTRPLVGCLLQPNRLHLLLSPQQLFLMSLDPMPFDIVFVVVVKL